MGLGGQREVLAACHSKANKQARLVQRKVCFISDVAMGERMADICPKADYPHDKQRMRAFIGRVWRRGSYTQEQQSSLTAIFKLVFKLVFSGLTSIILNVLGAVNLQFQGPFSLISLWSTLKIVEAHVLGTVWSSYS